MHLVWFVLVEPAINGSVSQRVTKGAGNTLLKTINGQYTYLLEVDLLGVIDISQDVNQTATATPIINDI